jgi:hypothetical protein
MLPPPDGFCAAISADNAVFDAALIPSAVAMLLYVAVGFVGSILTIVEPVYGLIAQFVPPALIVCVPVTEDVPAGPLVQPLALSE